MMVSRVWKKTLVSIDVTNPPTPIPGVKGTPFLSLQESCHPCLSKKFVTFFQINQSIPSTPLKK